MIGLPNVRVDQNRLEKELAAILDILDQIRAVDDRQEIFISIYMPYPGTPLFKLAIECGMKEPASLEEWAHIDLTKACSPWVPKAFARRIRYLNEFIFPYSKNVLDKDWDKFVRRRRFPFLTRIFKMVLKAIADWRLRNRFFILPIEWWVLRILKLGGQR